MTLSSLKNQVTEFVINASLALSNLVQLYPRKALNNQARRLLGITWSLYELVLIEALV